MAPIAALFLRNRPSEIGLPRYGENELLRGERKTENPAHRALSALRRGIRNRDFWLLAGTFFICGASTNGLVGTHLIPACIDNGIAEFTGASMLALMGAFNFVGTDLPMLFGHNPDDLIGTWTETAETACGGNRWAATFLDTFRYLDQLGRLAKAGVQIVMHNTLAASDYGLLGENNFVPRPNYWGALLWRRLMGTTVLESGVLIEAGLHVYAHCQRGTPDGVGLLVLNADRSAARTIRLASASARYTLDAANLDDSTVRLNGHALELGTKDDLPEIRGVPTPAGTLTFAPATITFLAIPAAANRACRTRH